MNYPPLPPVDDHSECEWSYPMRRTMQEIVPNLYLGPYSAAMKTKYDVLLQHNITHIICVRHNSEAYFIRPNFPERIDYLILNISYSPTENIIQHLPTVRKFLDDCISKGGSALVHGNAGISRSAALVLGYVMEKYGLPFKEAYDVVQQKRFCINLSERFIQQLKEYEPIYRAKRTQLNGQCSQENARRKRRLEDSDESVEPMDMASS